MAGTCIATSNFFAGVLSGSKNPEDSAAAPAQLEPAQQHRLSGSRSNHQPHTAAPTFGPGS
eukprot:1434138-Pleurochrysis_carterae.AAC.1